MAAALSTCGGKTIFGLSCLHYAASLVDVKSWRTTALKTLFKHAAPPLRAKTRRTPLPHSAARGNVRSMTRRKPRAYQPLLCLPVYLSPTLPHFHNVFTGLKQTEPAPCL